MLSKEMARRVIDSLPDDASLDDIIHALYVQVKFSHGETQIREAKGISQADAEKRLEQNPCLRIARRIPAIRTADLRPCMSDSWEIRHGR